MEVFILVIGTIILLFLFYIDIKLTQKEAQREQDHLFFLSNNDKNTKLKKKREEKIRQLRKEKLKRMRDRGII